MSLVSSVEAPALVADAIKKASTATGTSFEYLLKTAARESSFKADARAKTSSAAGLFQFIDDTWLKTVKDEGHRFGLGDYAADIVKTRTGRYHVADAGRRQEILALRDDPQIAATMAGAFTRQNADYVSTRLGREATEGELYMAHFLGPRGAARFIELAGDRPDARADRHFPKAARANRAIFYDGGRARSLAQVYETLVAGHRAADPAKTSTEAGMPAPPTPDPKPQLDASPLRPVKVAALTSNRLRLGSGTLTDVGLGSIGGWQAIVRPELASVPTPGNEETSEKPVSAAALAEPRPAPGPVRPQPAVPAARSPLGSVPSRLGIASTAFDLFQEDFWQRLASEGS